MRNILCLKIGERLRPMNFRLVHPGYVVGWAGPVHLQAQFRSTLQSSMQPNFHISLNSKNQKKKKTKNKKTNTKKQNRKKQKTKTNGVIWQLFLCTIQLTKRMCEYMEE